MEFDRVKTTFGEFGSGDYANYLDPDLTAWGEVWNFEINRNMLLPEHLLPLWACARHLKENPEYYCRVIGLASRSGSDAVNQEVSKLRCWEVRGELTWGQGVPLSQLRNQFGSMWLALGEQAWKVLGVKDGRVSENGRHRAVVMTVWKHNHPRMDQEMTVLRRIIRWDAR